MIGLCRMFGCLPSQLYAEDAAIFRLLKIAGYSDAMNGAADGE